MVRSRLEAAASHSGAVYLFRRAVRQVDRSLDGSIVGRRVTRLHRQLAVAWGASSTESGTSYGVDRSRTVVHGSIVASGVSALWDRSSALVREATPGARTVSLGEWGRVTTEQSFLYAWLTAEPEPDVIVIDLRETFTAGPVIAGLDHAIAQLVPGVRSSRITESCRRSLERLRERPVRYLGVLVFGVTAVSLLASVVRGHPSSVVLAVHVGILLVSLVGMRSERSYEELVESRVGSAVLDAFEPPEPIERADEDREE